MEYNVHNHTRDQYMKLHIMGDPIQDIWDYGYRDPISKRWNSTKRISRGGGAANTYNNIDAISKDLPIFPRALYCEEHPKLIRFITKEELDTETWVTNKELEKACRPAGNILRQRDYFADNCLGLVISEYNKGGCNFKTKHNLPKYEFAVIDSRYRTLDLSWIQTAKVKIWHATSNEYDDEWAQNFDYVLWTNGANTVTVTGPADGVPSLNYLKVPNTPVVDTIGAGDTFTAAVSVYLSWWLTKNNYATITMEPVLAATKFAIWCCQDVITKEYTAVCTKTLKEYLGD